MKIARESVENPNAKVVRAYGEGHIRINEETVEHSVILTETEMQDWQPQNFAEIELVHFDPVLAHDPEVVLLGTGAQLKFPDREIYNRMLNAGIGFEVMDTAAACRTFNILISEGRRVVAALVML